MIVAVVVYTKTMKVMDLVTEFFMPMKKVPTVTHQEKQVHVMNGKPVFYEPEELKAARAKLLAHLGQHVPKERYIGPVRLITKWCFPVSGKHQNGEYKTSKPDTDNLVKLLKDVMTELHFWKDDAQVASEITEKFWSDLPGIYVKVESL
ncbi:RusA family crossover junction endodeoxyribonuclease [Lacrimispora xylanisolvens]|uniref:RusA family crossover junction endodeoxyribonuclease n=1 Tax=Lacrimispora xylanisolvens TaxID=384636 RepID=UPI0024027039